MFASSRKDGTMNSAKYRHQLPQLNGQIILTDGGMETTLIFHEGIDLPHFAAFDLLRTVEGRAAVKAYFRRYAELARTHKRGFVLETPTWRASRDWGDLLGYGKEALRAVNQEAVELLSEIREEFETDETPFVISGNIGPRGDGYNPEILMTSAQAETYHSEQISVFAETDADMVTVLTMNYAEEAVGVTRAAQAAGLPVAVSFTVETDGRLPTGQTLGDAITQVDRETGSAPAYFMINCAHPTHFENAVAKEAEWIGRIRGLRANASQMSHAELDNADELDDGNPQELGEQYHALMHLLPNLVVLGGCCGTDHRHVEAISLALSDFRNGSANLAKSAAFRPPADATLPGRRSGSA
jgi:S-methylmethionine-dependent homocysteine/selenocysteine methylase